MTGLGVEGSSPADAAGRLEASHRLRAFWIWLGDAQRIAESETAEIDPRSVVAGGKPLLPPRFQHWLWGRVIYPKARKWVQAVQALEPTGESEPVDVVATRAGLAVFDGNHRVLLARHLGCPTIRARVRIPRWDPGETLASVLECFRDGPEGVQGTQETGRAVDPSRGATPGRRHPTGYPLAPYDGVCGTCAAGQRYLNGILLCAVADERRDAVRWVEPGWNACIHWRSGDVPPADPEHAH